MYRLACGPLNNKTPGVATHRLLCVPPCVRTAFCVHRLACGPLNNKTPAVATGRLLCVPPCVCTAFPPHTPPLPPPPTSPPYPPYLPPLPPRSPQNPPRPPPTPPTPPTPPNPPPYLQGRGGDFVRYMVEQTKPRLFMYLYVRSTLVVQPQHCHRITQTEEMREACTSTALSTSYGYKV